MTDPDTGPGAGDVTLLLQSWSRGSEDALEELTGLLYRELHGLAAAFMRRERGDHTLQPTALLHEAFLRLVRQNRVRWENREQFLSIAARVMRRVLVDHARRVQAEKRGGALQTISLDEADDVAADRDVDLVALDDALIRLAEMDAEQGRIVELRYFGGLTIAETAGVLSVSPATVKRRWDSARAWLRTQIEAT